MGGGGTALVLQLLFGMRRQRLDLFFRRQTPSTTGQLFSKINSVSQMAIDTTGGSFSLPTLSVWFSRLHPPVARLTLRSQIFLPHGRLHPSGSKPFIPCPTSTDLDKFALWSGQENSIHWNSSKKNCLRNLPTLQRLTEMTSASTVAGKMARGGRRLDASVLKKLMDAGGLLTQKAISFFPQVRVSLALKP